MAESASPNANVPAPVSQAGPDSHDRGASVHLMLWGGLSLVFVVYLVFGAINARIWKIVGFGGFSRWELDIESKSIARIWRIQGQNLPDVPRQWIMQTLFYGSIVVLVAGVIVAMRLLLIQAGEDTSPGPDDPS